MKISFIRIPLLASAVAVLLASTLGVTGAAKAQEMETTDNSAYWKKIQQSDSRIRACLSSWDVVFSTPSKTSTNIEQQVQRVMEQMKQKGGSESDIQDAGETARKILTDANKVSTQRSRLNFVRVGGKIRCEVNYLDAKTQGVELYDGKSSVYVETMVNGVRYSPQGYVRQDAKEVLSHSAPTWQLIRFLTGIPFSEKVSAYNPSLEEANSTLTENGGFLVLQKKTSPIAGQLGLEFPALLRVTLDKSNLRPTAYECVNLLIDDSNKRKMGRVDVSGYQLYQSNIWFPSTVNVRTPAFAAQYTLVEAKFNDMVDPAKLRLPANTQLIDSRFGANEKTIIYKAKDGQILNDTDVAKRIGLKTDKVKAQKSNEQDKANQVSPPKVLNSAISALGLIFVGFGATLWARAKKME